MPDDKVDIQAVEDQILSVFIEPLINKIISQINFDTLPSSSLYAQSTPEEIKKTFHDFVAQYLYNRKERQEIREGMNLIFDHSSRISNPEKLRQDLTKLANSLCDSAALIGKKNEELQEQVPRSTVPLGKDKNFINSPEFASLFQTNSAVSDESLTSIYSLGSNLFKEKKIKEAAAVFEIFCLLSPSCYEGWFSTGLCHHLQEDYVEAIANYSVAFIIHPHNLQILINLADCYLNIHDFSNLQETLHLAELVLQQSDLPLSSKERKAWQKAIDELK